MTARQRLEKLREDLKLRKTFDDVFRERQFETEFAEKHNVVHQHLCCLYCRFGVPDYDGMCTCVHPDRIIDVGGSPVDIRWNASPTDICDSYEERTPENEDIDDANP